MPITTSEPGEAIPPCACEKCTHERTETDPLQRALRTPASFVRQWHRSGGLEGFELVARSGEPLMSHPQRGDLLIRIIEGGSGQAAVIASSGLWRGHELPGRGLYADSEAADGYVHVTESAPFFHEASEGYARGVTDGGGRLLEDLLLLRLVTPPPTVVTVPQAAEIPYRPSSLPCLM